MSDFFVDTMIITLVVALITLLLLYVPTLRAKFKQWKTNQKRIRAHAGKVKCEDENCSEVSVCLTPNGYFCSFHWEPMSKRMMPGGGYITWHHVLYHAIRKS